MHLFEEQLPLSIADLIQIPEARESKFSFEYQELGTLLEPIYGRAIWSLFYRAGFTEWKIKEAHRIASERGIQKLGYIIGIVKRLP
jgi:hypothetical protein